MVKPLQKKENRTIPYIRSTALHRRIGCRPALAMYHTPCAATKSAASCTAMADGRRVQRRWARWDEPRMWRDTLTPYIGWATSEYLETVLLNIMYMTCAYIYILLTLIYIYSILYRKPALQEQTRRVSLPSLRSWLRLDPGFTQQGCFRWTSRRTSHGEPPGVSWWIHGLVRELQALMKQVRSTVYATRYSEDIRRYIYIYLIVPNM